MVMGERYKYKHEEIVEILSELPKLKLPTPFTDFKEWRNDAKFRTGYVVGILVNEDDPSISKIYIDGGRRREDEQGEIAIVLECVSLPTKKIVSTSIGV